MAPTESGAPLDMGNLTVGDIQGLDNPVLKAVLLKVKKHLEEQAAGVREPMAHTSHEVFYSEFHNA